MSLWSKLVSRVEALVPKNEPESHQLPSSMVAAQFGEVNVRRHAGRCDVSLTILMEPQGKDAEGWQTGVAVDASGSMKGAFGKGINLIGEIPRALLEDYVKKDWMVNQKYLLILIN